MATTEAKLIGDADAYWTAQQAADYIGVCTATLFRTGAPRYKFGYRTVRFLKAELDEWAIAKRVRTLIPRPPPARTPPFFMPSRANVPLRERLVIPGVT